MVEETQIVLKTVKELTSKEASDRAKAKIKMVKLAPQKEVDLSSDEESSSSEDIKDDEKAPIKQPRESSIRIHQLRSYPKNDTAVSGNDEELVRIPTSTQPDRVEV